MSLSFPLFLVAYSPLFYVQITYLRKKISSDCQTLYEHEEFFLLQRTVLRQKKAIFWFKKIKFDTFIGQMFIQNLFLKRNIKKKNQCLIFPSPRLVIHPDFTYKNNLLDIKVSPDHLIFNGSEEILFSARNNKGNLIKISCPILLLDKCFKFFLKRIIKKKNYNFFDLFLSRIGYSP